MKKIGIIVIALLSAYTAVAQQSDTSQSKPKKIFKPDILKPLKLSLNEDGSHFIQFTGLVQTWVRWDQSNPNSTVNGSTTGADNTWDVSLRRVRFQTLGQLSDRTFFYTQFGLNNNNYLSERKYGFFLMDAMGDYEFIKKFLSIGGGLSGWNGPLRFSSPGVASFMGLDPPVYQQTTNDLNSQFVRQFQIYAKGNIKKLSYRASIAKPFIVNSSVNNPANISGGQASIGTADAVVTANNNMQNNFATFSTLAPKPQFNGYIQYEFFDSEANKVPYKTGTYLGAKKIFNIGGGIQYQRNAMCYDITNPITAKTEVVYHQMLNAGLDVFYDAPVNKEKGTALSVYAAFLHSDFGPNYIRNLGVNNPTDAGQGYSGAAGKIYNNGGGSAFAMNGTGNTYSAQVGYKFKNDLLGEHGTLMPYISTQISAYQYFDYKAMTVIDVGVNWLVKGHNSKFTVDYQSRPYFSASAIGVTPTQTARRGMLVIQYQVSF
ncbi:MAG TPA: hypothetical protein VK766_04955 [Cytophagaceae bacterium]|jgi:hypothetical protein|nr:hypothetical protein [Cytophagaceae bacterium]